MTWVIAVTCFALLAVLRRRSKPTFLWMINAALAAIGGAALAATGLGGWIAGLIAGLLGWVGGMFGAPASGLAGGLVLLCVVVAVLDIVADRRADRPAITALIALPLLVLISAGPVSGGVAQVYDVVSEAGRSSVGHLIGGG